MQIANITLKNLEIVSLTLVDNDPKEIVGVFQVKNSSTGEIQTVNYNDILNIKFSAEV